MADTQSLNATFFAFRKREGGGVLLGASIAYAIALIVLFVAFAAALWFALGGMDFINWTNEVNAAQARGEQVTAPPPNLGGIFLMLPIELVFFFVFFVLLAAYESACVRWMVRGERSGPLSLHFGADMWRVYATYWLWLLYSIVGWVGFFLVLTIAGLIGGNLGAAGGWIAFGLGAAYFLAWFYTTVRLSPAAAASIGIGKFAPFKGWSATSGRFWALLGAFVVIFLLYLAAYVAVTSVFFGAFYAQVMSGLDWTTAQSDPNAFATAYSQATMQAMQSMFSNPMMIALYVGGQIAAVAVLLVFHLLYFGVASRAVQAALEEGKIEQEAAA